MNLTEQEIVAVMNTATDGISVLGLARRIIKAEFEKSQETHNNGIKILGAIAIISATLKEDKDLELKISALQGKDFVTYILNPEKNVVKFWACGLNGTFEDCFIRLAKKILESNTEL